MAKTSELRTLAAGFGLLSDPTRLGILKALAKGPKNVTLLCKTLGLKQPTLSHHLGLLRMGGLVIGTRKGNEVEYVTAVPEMWVMASALRNLVSKW